MALPALELYDHQETQSVSLERWRSEAECALPAIVAAARSSDAPIHHVGTVEFSFVSDETIAKVHGEFMGDPTPTDVITFQHGEILISLDTAQRQAGEHGEPYEREVVRYMVHGLLHLADWDDREESERMEMHRVQEAILKQLR
jgi:probable rRNA maturation factor